MIKKISLFIITLLILVLISQVSLAQDNQKLIRVGISTNDFSKLVYNNAEFSANGDFEILDSVSGEIIQDIPADTIIKIVFQNGFFKVMKDQDVIKSNLFGPVIIRPKSHCLLTINGLKRAGKPAYYRGVFELVKSSKGEDLFSIVNILDLESYLRGVVPNEMPVRFGLEALKAQTVAARTYALKPREKFYKEFNVCDSVACQVYFGANTEKELANTAIKQTNGIIALSKDNEPILALYSSTAGGYTESYENVFSEPKTRIFPPSIISYLQAQPDIKDMKPLNTEEKVREFYSSKPETFDNDSPYFRWKREWNIDELEKVLKTTLIQQSATGFIKPEITKNNIDLIGKLKDLQIVKRGDSGKVVFLDVITENGKYTLAKELVIRRTFKKDGKALPSGNFYIDRIEENSQIKFVFTGGGFGHGVGMSQYGAGAMSAKGYSFDEILQHYYTGIKLATNPLTLYTFEPKNSADQIFYAPYKKCILNVYNPDGISNLTVIINGQILRIDLAEQGGAYHKIEINNLIKKGENTIIYYLPDTDNKKRQLKVFVEIKEAKV